VGVSITIGAALGIGVVGYHYFGGMGPVDLITSHAGKLFASAYALFSGLLFIGAASLVLTPFVHRIMHKLHIQED